MPAALHATGLVVDVGPHRLLDGVDLALDPGHRLGLVGPNGVGKSTLLRVLAGELAPGRGALHRRPGDATVGLLAQEPARSTTETGRQAVHRRTGVAAADDALHAATADLAAGVAGADDRYSSALDRWTRLGAADLDARLDELADSIGLDGHQLDRPTARLSGGQAARLDLAALLAARFDVLLLDEPTNDLDLAGLDRLERFVSATDAATLIVSHDRAFLRRTIDGVVELDPFTHRLTRYGGGWDGYLTERRVAAEHAQRAYDTYEAKRGALLARAQTEREWATQGLRRARRAPADNDKNIRAFRINQTEQLAARAARTERAIERLDTVEQPRTAWELRLTFASAPRSGDIVARLEQAGVDRGGFCLGPLDLQITSGERVVIEGANGSGKTTLVGALLGDVELSTGRRFLGPGVRVGRLDQLRDQLNAAPTVLHGVIDAVGAPISDARTLLAKFGIATRHVDRPAGTLSPGERTRLVLAVLQARPANLLVLDEPTNHLDLPAIEQLESALDRFPGTIVLVSHDRVLLDAVRRTRTVRLADGQVVADEDGPTPR